MGEDNAIARRSRAALDVRDDLRMHDGLVALLPLERLAHRPVVPHGIADDAQAVEAQPGAERQAHRLT